MPGDTSTFVYTYDDSTSLLSDYATSLKEDNGLLKAIKEGRTGKLYFVKYKIWPILYFKEYIYDSYPDLEIVFTCSSLLEVYKGEADLSVKFHYGFWG